MSAFGGTSFARSSEPSKRRTRMTTRPTAIEGAVNEVSRQEPVIERVDADHQKRLMTTRHQVESERSPEFQRGVA